MQCRNCLRTIPDTAKMCQFCEASVEEEPTEEQQEFLREMIEQATAEVLDTVDEARAKGLTAEEIANRVLSGECPKCGSEETGSCEDDPELGDACVSRCYECGQLWRTVCHRLLESNAPSCECWD
jgi:hypothetical protein